jgi:hypothetical protein
MEEKGSAKRERRRARPLTTTLSPGLKPEEPSGPTAEKKK